MKLPKNKIYPNIYHPYRIIDDEHMAELKDSIKVHGIITPVIVRPLKGDDKGFYEIISGHRRCYAAAQVGLEEVPVDIRDISEDEATILMVDSNLHREHLSFSEKAQAYKMKFEAMKRQGMRTDLTSSQTATKYDTAGLIGKTSNESRDTVYRYIRLTNLIPDLINLMDENKMAFSVGVELSYLSLEHQMHLYDLIVQKDCTPSYSQAVRMHKAHNEGLLYLEDMDKIMSESKANQREIFRLPMEKVKPFAPKATKSQLEDFVLKACNHYRKYLDKRRNMER